MKKIVLFIFVAVFGVMTATAQEVDSLQSDDLSARVDSLSMQLKQLRRDYDFFYCKYLVEASSRDVDKFCLDIQLEAERIRVNSYHATWDVDSYIHYKSRIDNHEETLNLIKQGFELSRSIINLTKLRSNFTDLEKEFLETQLNTVERKCGVAERYIDAYKLAVELYKQAR